MIKKYMKNKYNADDGLPLNKKLNLYNMVRVVRSTFGKSNKYHLQVLLDECLCKFQLLKCNRIAVSKTIG